MVQPFHHPIKSIVRIQYPFFLTSKLSRFCIVLNKLLPLLLSYSLKLWFKHTRKNTTIGKRLIVLVLSGPRSYAPRFYRISLHSSPYPSALFPKCLNFFMKFETGGLLACIFLLFSSIGWLAILSTLKTSSSRLHLQDIHLFYNVWRILHPLL